MYLNFPNSSIVYVNFPSQHDAAARIGSIPRKIIILRPYVILRTTNETKGKYKEKQIAKLKLLYNTRNTVVFLYLHQWLYNDIS